MKWIVFAGLFMVLAAFTSAAPIHEGLCDGRSPGYWKNNEGCSHGSGSNPWANQLNVYSAQFEGVYGLTGSEICQAMDNDCGSDMPCKAKWHLLALELDVVSGKLPPTATVVIDGNTMTIQDVISDAESMIADGNPGNDENAKDLAEGAYSYYEPAKECEYDHQIPEFGIIAAGVAVTGAILGFIFLRKK